MTTEEKNEKAEQQNEADPSEKNDSLSKEGTEHIEDPLKEDGENLDSSEKEAKQHYDNFLRASAELENFKKRSSREMNDLRKYANEALLRELLPIVDSLELAIVSSSNDKKSENGVVEGVGMTLKEILKVFEKFSVKPIEAVGNQFDPAFHQAIQQEETDKHPENTVVQEFQKGYMIHDRLLRPSMVIVSKGKKDTDLKKE